MGSLPKLLFLSEAWRGSDILGMALRVTYQLFLGHEPSLWSDSGRCQSRDLWEAVFWLKMVLSFCRRGGPVPTASCETPDFVNVRALGWHPKAFWVPFMVFTLTVTTSTSSFEGESVLSWKT